MEGKTAAVRSFQRRKVKVFRLWFFFSLNSIFIYFFYFSKILNKQRPGYCARRRRRAEMYSFCLCSVHMVKDAQNASAIFMHIARCAPCFQQSTVWTVSLLDSLFARRHRQRWLRAEDDSLWGKGMESEKEQVQKKMSIYKNFKTTKQNIFFLWVSLTKTDF